MRSIKLLIFIFTLLFLTFSFLKSVMADESHEGDIILSGNDTLLIENSTYTQTGNIFVNDNATLILRNATLIINLRYHGEFDIEVSGNGTLEIISSRMITGIPNESIEITFMDDSSLIVQDSDLEEGMISFTFGRRSSGDVSVPLFSGNASISNTKFAGLGIVFSPEAGGNISVSNSECGTFSLVFRDNYQGEFSDLKPSLFTLWTYKKDNYDITIQNTYFANINVACDGSSQVVVRNSELLAFAPYASLSTISLKAVDSIILRIAVPFWSVTASIWGLKTGLHSYWKLSDHSAGDAIPELILENTEVISGWSLMGCWGSNVSIDDAVMDRLRSNWDDNNISVTNSTVSELMLYQSTDSVLTFDNTTIQILSVYVPPNTTEIKGNITFTENALISSWFSPSTIKRIYPVTTIDQSGNIISGANLSLYSQDGTLIWLGQTDEQGEASFEIEFNDDNYTDSWRLGIEYDGKSISKEIKLLSSTPIILNDPPTADAGSDQTVDEGATVTLDGSNSSDPDDGIASYQWTQTGGTSVTLSDATASQPTFTTPDVGPEGESLTFELTVTDKGGLLSTDSCVVNVTDSSDGGGGAGGCFIAVINEN